MTDFIMCFKTGFNDCFAACEIINYQFVNKINLSHC